MTFLGLRCNVRRVFISCSDDAGSPAFRTYLDVTLNGVHLLFGLVQISEQDPDQDGAEEASYGQTSVKPQK